MLVWDPVCACDKRGNAEAQKWKYTNGTNFVARFAIADWQNFLPLSHKNMISLLFVLAIFRFVCHFPPVRTPFLAGHARKVGTGPRMSLKAVSPL